jgi:hypothetical protein
LGKYDSRRPGAQAQTTAAWLEMLKLMPQQEDEIIGLLAMLTKLERGLLSSVPGAENFMRPGLDE